MSLNTDLVDELNWCYTKNG